MNEEPPRARPIAGGPVPPGRVIGRERTIRSLWRRLEHQSVLLASERRIGKTSVLVKMEAEPPDGWRAVRTLVEATQSPTAFVGQIVRDVAPLLKRRTALWRRLQDVVERIGGKLGDWSIPALQGRWKELLWATFEDIEEQIEGRIVFLWDEVTSMVDNIARNKELGPMVAAELLDALRHYRMQRGASSRIRMVYTGSVGLHLVLRKLAETGYTDDPINDMHTESLGALAPADARALARRGLAALVDDGDLELADDLDHVAAEVATRTDALPFYIDKVLVTLQDVGAPVRTSDIGGVVLRLIRDVDDSASFAHYADRIAAYYDFHEGAQELAHTLLDALARADGPLDDAALDSAVATQLADSAERRTRELLRLLARDHYLVPEWEDDVRRWRFKYPIVKRWWRDMQAAGGR